MRAVVRKVPSGRHRKHGEQKERADVEHLGKLHVLQGDGRARSKRGREWSARDERGVAAVYTFWEDRDRAV